MSDNLETLIGKTEGEGNQQKENRYKKEELHLSVFGVFLSLPLSFVMLSVFVNLERDFLEIQETNTAF